MNKLLNARMPQAMKDQWLKDLRSGEFAQATGKLKVDGGYCCLGVLQQRCDGDVQRCEVYEGRPPIGYPTKEWYAAHGIEVPDGYSAFVVTLKDGTTCFLAGENDGGVPFSKIADVIEEYVDGY